MLFECFSINFIDFNFGRNSSRTTKIVIDGILMVCDIVQIIFQSGFRNRVEKYHYVKASVSAYHLHHIVCISKIDI